MRIAEPRNLGKDHKIGQRRLQNRPKVKLLRNWTNLSDKVGLHAQCRHRGEEGDVELSVQEFARLSDGRSYSNDM